MMWLDSARATGARAAAKLLAASLAVSACAQQPPQGDVLELLGRTAAAGLRVQVAAAGGEADLVADAVATPNSARAGEAPNDARVQRVPRGDGGSALDFHWRNSWFSSLRLVAQRPMDLRGWLPDATLELELNALDVARSGIDFAMGCGPGCTRKVSYAPASRALQGTGWQRVAIPLRCFARDGNDFSAVTMPLALESGGGGRVKVSNLRLVRRGTPTVTCVDHRVESVTPVPLQQTWSLDWWMPRHETKLAELHALRLAGKAPQLLFIGDSITEGWEKEGRAVWAEAFARYRPFNLGYGGDRTENVLWRLQNGEIDGITPKAVVLMIGTNNSGHRQEDPATTAAGIRRLVQELRSRLPGAKLLLLGVFPRDEQPGTRLRRLNEAVNTQIASLHDGRDIIYMDIGSVLTQPDGTLSRDVMPDLLHLSEEGYRRWARAIAPALEQLMSAAP